MPVSYSPDLRLKYLEKLLKDKSHYPEKCNVDEYRGYWTKEELAIKISEIFELTRTLSEKTIENDLKKMDIDYNAPIDKKIISLPSFKNNNQGKHVNKIAYFYFDDGKSIFDNNNLSKEDLKSLRTVVGMLKQFKGFKYFEDIDLLIGKLETKVTKSTFDQIIFDTLDEYSGSEHIDIVATAVKEKKALIINYKPFSESVEKTYTIHPYQLREYNNRWFVLAHTEEFSERKVGVYGLGRITKEPEFSNSPKGFNNEFAEQTATYFNDIIGVTNFLDKNVERIVFEVYGLRANYIVTKPWHQSQKLIEDTPDKKTFSINVKINPELIALILQFGKDLKILQPEELKITIANEFENAVQLYK